MWNVIIQGCVILASLLAVHNFGGGVRIMVMTYVIIIITWTAIWHCFVNRLIGYGWLRAMNDMLPYFFISIGTMLFTHHLSLTITEQPLELMCVRIIIAATTYLSVCFVTRLIPKK